MISRFKYTAYIVFILAIVFTGILAITISGNSFSKSTPIVFYLLFTLYFIFVWIWLVFGELRTKVIFIQFDHDSIRVKRYLGLGASKKYYFNKMDGFKTSILSSNAGSYEYLYLITAGKKLIKLSEFYHKNYKELKQEVFAQSVQNLGFERFRYRGELKEMFERL